MVDIGSYVSVLEKEKEKPENKRRLNLVSEFDNFHKVGNYIPNTERKNHDENISENKRSIKSALDNKMNYSSQANLEKLMEQTSSLFNDDFYNNLSSKFFSFF